MSSALQIRGVNKINPHGKNTTKPAGSLHLYKITHFDYKLANNINSPTAHDLEDSDLGPEILTSRNLQPCQLDFTQLMSTEDVGTPPTVFAYYHTYDGLNSNST